MPFTLYAYPVGGSPKPPFIIYRVDSTKTIPADNEPYIELVHMEVELYEREANLELEDKLYNHLLEHFIFVERTEAWMESEHARVVYYDFQVNPKLLK